MTAQYVKKLDKYIRNEYGRCHKPRDEDKRRCSEEIRKKHSDLYRIPLEIQRRESRRAYLLLLFLLFQ
ncbi:MAG: hypothetical protein D3909_07320 [Candidatus Electrothrix sp. ATG1]|nr:hypothetical protein [Candidatus Electrothrix sp. ATG1]